jgi:hypothetical protein
VFFKSAFESVEKLSAKDDTEYFDGQKELVSTGNPTPLIGREPSPRDDAMQMGMMQEGLAPSMQDRQKPDLSAEVFGISGDLEEGLGCGPKKQAVNQSLVLQGQGSQDVG